MSRNNQQNKEGCPMCKISDDVIKNLAQGDGDIKKICRTSDVLHKNNNNISKKASPAAVRGVGFFGKLKKIFK